MVTQCDSVGLVWVGPDGDGATDHGAGLDRAEVAAIVAVATGADDDNLVRPERHAAAPHRQPKTTVVGDRRDGA